MYQNFCHFTRSSQFRHEQTFRRIRVRLRKKRSRQNVVSIVSICTAHDFNLLMPDDVLDLEVANLEVFRSITLACVVRNRDSRLLVAVNRARSIDVIFSSLRSYCGRTSAVGMPSLRQSIRLLLSKEQQYVACDAPT